MRFSIIVPVYNIAPFLEECVESILRQSFRDYELFLVDDGSTDASGSICDSYAAKDPRVKVIHKENGGLVSVRKTAAALVSGDYVLSVDGDDWIGEDYLQTVAEKIDETGADMIAWGYTRTETDGTKRMSLLNRAECGIYEGERLDAIRRSYLFDPEQDEINMGSLLYNLADKAIKREFYAASQPQVPDGVTEGEDAAANWLILKQISSLQVIDMDSYYYRLNSASITGSLKTESIKRQKLLEDFLLKHADNEWQLKQIRGFAFYRVIFVLDRAVKSGYKNYKALMKAGEEEGIYGQCVKAEIKNISKGNALRMFLIKKRMWGPLFLYHKMRSGA
ncbi:MAG: glycosyltransferase [Lachnospiraceae bacterium]|nr:glycosyltransferase [Lachnospiraceae bacterium]